MCHSCQGTMIILECNIGASTGFIALHHMLNKTKEQWCEQIHAWWSTRVVMCYLMPGTELESDFWMTWRALSHPACSKCNFFSPYLRLKELFQHLLVHFHTPPPSRISFSITSEPCIPLITLGRRKGVLHWIGEAFQFFGCSGTSTLCTHLDYHAPSWLLHRGNALAAWHYALDLQLHS
jgi:hypothetical protein